jgi:hypothetical protein
MIESSSLIATNQVITIKKDFITRDFSYVVNSHGYDDAEETDLSFKQIGILLNAKYDVIHYNKIPEDIKIDFIPIFKKIRELSSEHIWLRKLSFFLPR